MKMSCICQYYAPALDRPSELLDPAVSPIEATDAEPSETVEDASDLPATDDQKVAVCASDLANCRAENWLLQKKLHESEITIQNLEHLVSSIVEKQHQILSEMFDLRKLNAELELETRQQREYHLMERNALMKELHDMQVLQSARSKTLLKTQTQTRAEMEDDGNTEADTGTEDDDDDDEAETNVDEDESEDDSGDSDADEDDDSESEEEDEDDDDDDDNDNEDEAESESDCSSEFDDILLPIARQAMSRNKSRKSHRSRQQSSSSSDASDTDIDNESRITKKTARSTQRNRLN